MCVVTFNRFDMLRTTLAALLAEPVATVVVVDNGSTDGTREWLAAATEPRLDVVFAPRNLGGAGGFELAMGHALDHHAPDWLLLQDDDAYPTAGAVDAFLAENIDDDIGGVGAAVYTVEGEICEINRPGLNPFRTRWGAVRALVVGRRALHIDDSAYTTGNTDVDCISFVGYFVRAELTRRIGLPRGDFFIYSDDQLYSYSVRQAGARNVFCPAIRYVHATTSKSEQGYFTPEWKVYFLYRNNLEFYRAMAGRWFPLVAAVKLPQWLLRVRLYPRKRLYLRIAGRGVWDGLRRDFSKPHADVLAMSR